MRSLTGLGRAFAARLGAAALGLGLAGPAEAESGSLELAAKATYLYRLAPFVTWPGNAATLVGPLFICVQGDDPFGLLLDRIVAGQSVAGRSLIVRRLPRLEPDSDCAIAYVAGSSAQSQAQALAAVEKAPVLTVTDAARGGARGIVHLHLEGGQVRFSIDAAKAEIAGVEISSKLLALAVVVKR